jgi:uncharacterized protein (UPF0210 family)
MKIRTITYFLDPGWPLNADVVQHAGEFIVAARPAFESAGYEVQTSRLATPPFPKLLETPVLEDILSFVHELDEKTRLYGYDYISIGPALPDDLRSYELIPDIIRASENVFLTGSMTTGKREISLPAVKACAQVIFRVSRLSPDGFSNLRFAALANVPPGAPFFPAAYHNSESDEGEPCFALGMEAANVAVSAVKNASSLAGVRKNLVLALEDHAARIQEVGKEMESLFGVRFKGIDFTPAPFPLDDLSFGSAIEDLGVPAVGLYGSLAAAAFLAEALDRAQFPRAGFNGLFFPVLEDAVLAKRAALGTLTVKDLLLFSTMCGTGLDTVPLPGDVAVEDLYAILLDVSFMSQRLDKPLTARLMPIPGKAAGDKTDFDFDYFANSRVLGVQTAPIEGLLAGDESVQIKSRRALH